MVHTSSTNYQISIINACSIWVPHWLYMCQLSSKSDKNWVLQTLGDQLLVVSSCWSCDSIYPALIRNRARHWTFNFDDRLQAWRWVITVSPRGWTSSPPRLHRVNGRRLGRTQRTALRQGCLPLGWHLLKHYSIQVGGLGIGTEFCFSATRKGPVFGLVAIGVCNHLLSWKIVFAVSWLWIHCWWWNNDLSNVCTSGQCQAQF